MPDTFDIVLECKVPSIVTGHLTLMPEAINSTLVQAALIPWLLVESRVAEAVPTAAAIMPAAASVPTMS
jgi:hypothetical protein